MQYLYGKIQINWCHKKQIKIIDKHSYRLKKGLVVNFRDMIYWHWASWVFSKKSLSLISCCPHFCPQQSIDCNRYKLTSLIINWKIQNKLNQHALDGDEHVQMPSARDSVTVLKIGGEDGMGFTCNLCPFITNLWDERLTDANRKSNVCPMYDPWFHKVYD